MNRKQEIEALRPHVAAAYHAAKTAAELCPDDSGTSNLDDVAVKPPKGTRRADVLRAFPAWYRLESAWPWRGCYLVGAPQGGQARRREVACEAFRNRLQPHLPPGWNIYTYQQMD
jgi:hypothetical protein